MTLKTFSSRAAFGALLLFCPIAHAKDAAVRSFDQQAFLKSAEEQEGELFIRGKLVSLEKLFAAKPSTQPITFAEPATTKLDPPDLHDKLLKSTLVVGLYYKCHECDRMHFETGGGFPVAKGGIVSTCAHMMDLQPKLMLEAYPVAIDSDGRVYPIDQILAYDAAADTCLVHVAGGDFPVLSVRSNARSGEPTYCLSHPGTNLFIFTSGLISRVEGETAKGRTRKSLDVSCEYSPGSSGSAIVDAAGNVVAQVDKISPQMLFQNEDKQTGPAATVYNLRRATAGEEIIRLGDPANREAFPPPPKSDKKSSDTPPDPAGGAVFGVANDYDLVFTPADFDLPGKVKSFADLYALNAANQSTFTPWSSDDKPNSTLQLNYQKSGFTGNTGRFYRIPGTSGPRTSENAIDRTFDFKFTFDKLKDSTVGLHIVVNDNRYTEKAVPNRFNIDTVIPTQGFQLVKLGEPQKGKQAWLAVQINKIMENAQPAEATPVKALPGNKIHLKFTAADGREVDTDKMLGKVILVDYWATWCGPCIEALPRLEALYTKYHDRGFEIIGINLDENRQVMDKFLATHKHPWPQSVAAPLGKNPLADPLGFQSIPTFLLIDKKGVYTAIEARNPDTEKKIEALLKQ